MKVTPFGISIAIDSKKATCSEILVCWINSNSLVKDFNFKVEEIHHKQKKDNPGGTAKTLRADLEKIVNKKHGYYSMDNLFEG